MPKYLWFQADFLGSQILDITKLKKKKTLAPRLKKGPSNPRTPLPSILQLSNCRAPYPGRLILRIVSSAPCMSLKIISHIEV
jgi:hypothetical protein